MSVFFWKWLAFSVCATALGLLLAMVIESNMTGPATRTLSDAVSWGFFWIALFPLFQLARAKRTGSPDPSPGRSLVLHAIGVVFGLVVYHGIRLLAG